MSAPPYRGRFAPSPTGPLHFGSLLAALGSWLLARHAGGQWLIRVEDIDTPRLLPGAIRAQLHMLAACGLHSDLAVVRQSERHALYQQALSRLLQQGSAFECNCSRNDLARCNGIHHHCVNSSAHTQRATRLRVAPGSPIAFEDRLQGHVEQDVYQKIGDFVLFRADGYWAYQLAVVVDDAAQGITDVVRGADLLDSTPRQILLQRALGLPQPRYLHLPLAVDSMGRKLSKSTAALPVDASAPLPALRAAWQALGQPPAVLSDCGSAEKLLHRAMQHFRPEWLPCRLVLEAQP
jgi:glutamyl-Q tRNA(Asp) synthetase